MRSILLRKAAYVPLLALTLGSAAMASPIVNAAAMIAPEAESPIGQAKASELLREVRALSLQLRTDADTLESLRRQSRITWNTHAFQLNYVREHVNNIGSRLAQLEDIRASAAPWQQRAIDEITPVAQNLASHTQAAIQQLNTDRSQIRTPIYQDHLASIQDHSKTLHASVDAYLDYHEASKTLENTQQKLEELREKIGLNES